MLAGQPGMPSVGLSMFDVECSLSCAKRLLIDIYCMVCCMPVTCQDPVACVMHDAHVACLCHLKVNGTEMPSGNGAENRIHAHIGQIKSRDECIAIKFEGVTPYLPAFGTACPTAYMTACCTVPNHEAVTVTFESFVTKTDLKGALRLHEALALVLGVSLSSDQDLHALFEKYDLYNSAISRSEWRAFVKRLHAAAMARKQAQTWTHRSLHMPTTVVNECKKHACAGGEAGKGLGRGHRACRHAAAQAR